MSAHPHPAKATHHTRRQGRRRPLARIAVGVNGFPEGNDAVALAELIARATGAELLLVAVHTDPLVVLPDGMNWTSLEEQAQQALREARDAFAPEARICVETDLFVARALKRVISRERRDLLVVGSDRHGAEGQVRIGKRTRQLMDEAHCALAVSPRGMSTRADRELKRIGVGYDGSSESAEALTLAAAMAMGGDAELRLCGVVDDRVRSIGWSRFGGFAGGSDEWDELVKTSEQQLATELQAAGADLDCEVTTEIRRGRPADVLLELARDVDMVVIGSRRWGPPARLVLGSTGESLVFRATCPVMVAPRPSA